MQHHNFYPLPSANLGLSLRVVLMDLPVFSFLKPMSHLQDNLKETVLLKNSVGYLVMNRPTRYPIDAPRIISEG